MYLYQYGRVAVVQLAVEGVVEKTASLLSAIQVHSSMFCCKLKLFRSQTLSTMWTNRVVVDLRDNKHCQILIRQNKRLHAKNRCTVDYVLHRAKESTTSYRNLVNLHARTSCDAHCDSRSWCSGGSERDHHQVVIFYRCLLELLQADEKNSTTKS